MLSVRWEQLPSFEIGKEEGKKEGRVETQKTMVINAYKAQLDIKTMSQISGLSKEEVTDIVNQWKKENGE